MSIVLILLLLCILLGMTVLIDTVKEKADDILKKLEKK